MLLKKRPRAIEKGFCPEIPPAFSSLEQARNSLDYHWNGCTELLHEIERKAQEFKTTGDEDHRPFDVLRTMGTVRQDIFDILERWLVSFQTFLRATGSSIDSRGLQAAQILEMSHSTAMLYLNFSTVSAFNDEMAWDKFTENFEHLVNLAAPIIESYTYDTSTLNGGPGFTMDMSTVGPLYIVAHRCRHPAIRRKAVSLLYAAPRQEGLWDSITSARVAERLISIEESGLGNVTRSEDVPDWARISDVEVEFDLQERQGIVKFSRQRGALEKVRDRFVELVRW